MSRKRRVLGKRSDILANAAFQRANDWVGRVEGVPAYCENVSVEAIRSDERLLRNWRLAIRSALAALKSLEKKLGDLAEP
jgi:hypothetical protein